MADVVDKKIELFFQEGSSDKLYLAELIVHDDQTCSVSVQWGRRGSTLSVGNKAVRVSRAEATRAFDKVVREKTSKGYQEITSSVAPAATAPPVGQGSASKAGVVRRPQVGPKAQLLTPLDDDELERFLDDDAWVAQQKLDGVRVIATVRDDGVLLTNRDGQASETVPQSAVAGLEALEVGTVVDGEVVGGRYWVFDALRVGDRDVTALGVVERWELVDELSPGFPDNIEVVPLRQGRAAKRALHQQMVAQSAEGLVFKQRDAPYVGGRPSSGGTQRKHKLVKTCDVVVTENAGNAYTMVVFDGAVKRHGVGKVFAGTTNAIRAQLDALLAAGEEPVCEVQYLYATDDDQLYQPVFVRVRDDKPAEACTREQLKKTNRAVVA